MPVPLNILVIEDSPDDAALLVAELQSAGFEPKWSRVQTEPDFRAGLRDRPDLVFSDFTLPQFSVHRALEVLRENDLDIPFIVVSGTIGEERAVESLKAGATDYVLKDRPQRLGPAVRRALTEAQERTERLRAQQELRLRTTALEAAANGILITNRDGVILWANTAFCTMTGYALEEVIGKSPRFLRSGKHDPHFYADMWSTVFSGRVWRGEVTNRRQNGSLYDEEMTITPVRATGGDITHFIAVKQDITGRKHAEEARRESEGKFRQLAENINEVFWITDPQKNQMLYISPAYERIWGRACDSLYQSLCAWTDAIHPEDRERIRVAAITKHTRGDYDEIYRITRPDGSVRWVHDRAFPLRDAEGSVYRVVGTAEDITAQRNLEEQFRQSQKMESIGQLAGGIAHDFNNILTVIQGHASLNLLDSTLSEDAKESAEQISLAAERAASLTRQLLTFSRRQVIQTRSLNLNDVIEGVIQMLRRVLGADIELHFGPSSLPPILADAGMLEQILMNLAVNARDAMPKGGALKIRTGVATIDETFARQNPEASAGQFVWLTVADSGCGIPSENLSKIFEPFFTTKEVGKGTGLGLATVYGIVKQHHGWVTLTSELNKGTTFKIYFPAAHGQIETRRGPPSEEKTRGGTETILLVEDEVAVRRLVRNTLEARGYRVVEADSGRAALSEWQRHGGKINLLLTDLVMPGGMTGRDLADTLRTEDPKLRVIFMSGYGAEIVGKDFRLRQGVNFLQKPFPPRTLAACVRDCLDSSGT